MFGKSAQKRIIRDIDKIVSLKEDLDALSWGRVHEIGRALLSDIDQKEQKALGAELMKIAQANTSMYSRMGVMPFTEQMLEQVTHHSVEDTAQSAHSSSTSEQFAPKQSSATVGKELGSEAGVVSSNLKGVTQDSREHVGEQTQAGACSSSQTTERVVEDEIVLPSGMTVMEGGLVEAALEHPEQIEAPLSTDTAYPLDEKTAEELGFALDEVEDFFGTGAPVFEFPATPVGGKVRIELTPVSEVNKARSTEAEKSDARETQKHTPLASTAETPVLEEAAERVIVENATQQINHQLEKIPVSQIRRDSFGRFHHLYESRDGALCVFQDEMGHLVSVKSSRLV